MIQPERRTLAAIIDLLKGRLLFRRNDLDASEAWDCFRTAIEVARKSDDRMTELQATVDLALLLAHSGSTDQARSMIAEIYDSFTEGFDTPDLKRANALIGQLEPTKLAELHGRQSI